MLKYLIAVTGSTAVPAVLLGLLCAWIVPAYKRRGTLTVCVSAVAATLAALAYTILRNTTKVIDKSGGASMWNVRVFAVSAFALIIFYIFSPLAARRKAGGAVRALALAAAGVLTLTQTFYAMAQVMMNISKFNLGGEGMLSTAFITRIIGLILGLVIAVVILTAMIQVALRMKPGTVLALLWAVLFVNAFQQVSSALGTLYSKRYISGHGLFQFIKFTTNHSDLFTYVIMAVAFAIPVVLWIRSFDVREPYRNAAEHRKIKAKWRSIRRWSTALVCAFVLVVLCLTWFTAIDNREIELSPVEECEVRDGACYVAMTQVDDGHLHRFAYTTENGVEIRFIIIKKPNSSSYGVGLDACDICGETGYFERGGQVVCKLCDVVMNINTIGFKGGCNPIVVPWSIEEGFIALPIEGLVEYESEFK
ncbi:MAG: Fe-S-containing protein [Clostridia bacterium]|nr:Fe-S-containing protein [Clostridia bacterium]